MPVAHAEVRCLFAKNTTRGKPMSKNPNAASQKQTRTRPKLRKWEKLRLHDWTSIKGELAEWAPLKHLAWKNITVDWLVVNLNVDQCLSTEEEWQREE